MNHNLARVQRGSSAGVGLEYESYGPTKHGVFSENMQTILSGTSTRVSSALSFYIYIELGYNDCYFCRRVCQKNPFFAQNFRSSGLSFLLGPINHPKNLSEGLVIFFTYIGPKRNDNPDDLRFPMKNAFSDTYYSAGLCLNRN